MQIKFLGRGRQKILRWVGRQNCGKLKNCMTGDLENRRTATHNGNGSVRLNQPCHIAVTLCTFTTLLPFAGTAHNGMHIRSNHIHAEFKRHMITVLNPFPKRAN